MERLCSRNKIKRIGLFLDKAPHAGGAFNYSLSMLEAVSAMPRDLYHAVVVYTNKEWLERLKKYDIECSYVSIPLVSRMAEYIWRKAGLPIIGWRKFITPIYPPSCHLLALDCVLWIYPAQDPMTYLLPVPALATVHDLMHRYEPKFPEVSGYRMRELHYRAICRWAKGILVDSEIGKKQLVESYDVDPEWVYPLPYIAPAYMTISKATNHQFDEHYRLPSRFFYYPAQFWSHKNHGAILRAMKLLSPSYPDIEFVFSGAPKNGLKNIKKLASSLGIAERIHNLGYIPDEDVAEIYCRARALIMPTFFGPTNIPPLEAMAVGCPVAVSAIYGMPAQCGDAALYFDPNSDKEIADVMAQLWSDDKCCAMLAERGRMRALMYTQEAFDQKVAMIVNKMIS